MSECGHERKTLPASAVDAQKFAPLTLFKAQSPILPATRMVSPRRGRRDCGAAGDRRRSVSTRRTAFVSRSAGLAHIVRRDDGTSTGVWGVYTIKSAFQPVFAFSEGKLAIAAFEGLVRPFRDGAALSPYAFFRGIPPIDRFHVETLMRTLHLLNGTEIRLYRRAAPLRRRPARQRFQDRRR
jgi:hypothetical protein